MGTKFGRKNPSPDQRVTHCWDQRLCRGQARVNQRSNTLGDAGVIRGHSEGNCLEMHKAIKCSQCYRALCSCRCSSKVKNNWPHTSKNFDFRRSITSLWKLLWVKTFQIWVSLNETFNLIYSFLCFDENWNFTFFTYKVCEIAYNTKEADFATHFAACPHRAFVLSTPSHRSTYIQLQQTLQQA